MEGFPICYFGLFIDNIITHAHEYLGELLLHSVILEVHTIK